MQPDCNNATSHEPSDSPASSHRWLDRMGIGVSITCAVHCVGAALLAAACLRGATAFPGLDDL